MLEFMVYWQLNYNNDNFVVVGSEMDICNEQAMLQDYYICELQLRYVPITN